MRDELKKWVVNDYFTPNIKAEVILDALLTPYIAGIIKDQCGVDTVFVTKEMSVLDRDPSKQNQNYGNRGTKIDYILASEREKTVYLVELKTTIGSIKLEQADRYLNNCWNEKENEARTFGEVFGNKLLKIMDKPDATPSESRLRTLFGEFVKEYDPKVKDKLNAERAKALLKEKGWDSTKKYLYTMGQLLNYLDDKQFPNRTLWDLPLKLIYVTPTGSLPHKKLLDHKDFYLCPDYLCPKEKGSVSLKKAEAYLRRMQGDELARLLADILKEIYGE